MRSEDAGATIAVGERLARGLRGGDIVLIAGPLGAGKTVLVRGIVGGIDRGARDLVSSQSYVIVGEYPTEPKTTHLDLYRLERTEEVVALGWEEILYGGAIVLVEWPDLLLPLIEPEDPLLRVSMAIEPDGARTIELRSDDSHLDEVITWTMAGS